MTPREDALERYLREIGKYPLVDREEEARLARRIRAGEEEALDKLVRSNLRFVVSVSKRYQNQGVPLADLINEGNVGLIRAAHKFDETRGVKFITYAVWWIRQAILQALAEQGRIVRVPLNRASAVRRIGRHAAQLRQELGREPSIREIAAGLDLPEKDVELGLAVGRSHLSLDAPPTPGEGGPLMDYLPDRVSRKPDEETFEKALNETLNEALETLDEREAITLRLYFGLDGRRPRSLAEISQRLGVTRERVRQIKEKAIARLRHHSRARLLESFKR